MAVYRNTVMEEIRLDAVSKRCIVCCSALGVRDRVLGAYRVGELRAATPDVEVGLFTGGCRPLFRHVNCTDPTLLAWKMKPSIHHCIRCRKALKNSDVVQPVFGVENANAVNPYDPHDVGLTLGERIYFVHVDCKNLELASGQGLLVTP